MLGKNIWLILLSSFLCLWGTQAAIADMPMALVRFNPPPDDPQPEKTVLGGRRSPKNCEGNPVAQPTFTALVPQNQKGLTTEKYPTLWVYIPETSAKHVVLTIKEQVNGQFQSHSQRFFFLPNQPGLVGLQMSDQEAPLEVGKTYKWATILVCGNLVHPNDPVIEGLVSRVDTPITQATQDWLTRSAWYGEKGIWYDTLENLAEARHASPSNSTLINNWITLLKSVGLESVAPAPLLF
ncbi:MAG: DUF928 domain-containing protein [Snowella sp.]|nr:DUF928 domain-containing protein [Snowella sp.]